MPGGDNINQEGIFHIGYQKNVHPAAQSSPRSGSRSFAGLVTLLEEQKALLIAVATGGPRIDLKNSEYQERRQRILELLPENASDPSPFGDLWQWYGKWSDGTLPSYQSRRNYINQLFQPLIDNLARGRFEAAKVSNAPAPSQTEKGNMLDIFISHSGRDRDLAKSVAEFLRSALSLRPEQIRCTSVDGYRLPVGVSTNERLRMEVRDAKVFLALLTRNSALSTYCLFEMGARWGSALHFVPVSAGGLPISELKAPLSSFNGLDLSYRAQAIQLVENLSEMLGITPVALSAIEESLATLVTICAKHIADPLDPPLSITRASWGVPGNEIDVTVVLARRIRKNQAVVQANSDAFGGVDPAPGRVKRLLIEYALGSDSNVVTVNEGDAEVIPRKE